MASYVCDRQHLGVISENKRILLSRKIITYLVDVMLDNWSMLVRWTELPFHSSTRIRQRNVYLCLVVCDRGTWVMHVLQLTGTESSTRSMQFGERRWSNAGSVTPSTWAPNGPRQV